MQYSHELIFSALILVCLFYVIRQGYKWIKHTKPGNPVNPMQLAAEDPDDDFMCILKADGSTVASCGGIVVTGRRPK